MSKIDWILIESEDQLSQIKARSFEVPCLIFKHSTSCSISSMSKMRLESGWDFDASQLEAYFLDLIRFRNISHKIANDFEVHHESPQMILVDKGEVILDASHLDVTVPELRSVYNPA